MSQAACTAVDHGTWHAGTWTRVRRLATPLAAVTLGSAVYTRACPPHEWALAAWAVPGLFLLGVRNLRPLQAAACGALFAVLLGWGMAGWTLHAALAYFEFDRMAAAGFVVLMWLLYGGIPYGLLAVAYGPVMRRLSPVAQAPVGAWLWVGAEVLRVVLFTGLPWELLGHTQFRHLVLAQIADLGGVYAVSFVMAWVSLSAAELLRDLAHARPWRPALVRRLAPALVLLAAVTAYGLDRRARYDGADAGEPALTVAVVQGNLPNAFRWKRVFFEQALAMYADLTERTLGARPDLIVWPELAVNFYLEREPLLRQQLESVAGHARAGLLVGGPRLTAENQARNSAYLLTPAGTIAATYDKRRLVPFAEYNPLPDWGRDAVAEPEGYTPGTAAEPLESAGLRLGTVICYEALFPGLVRDLVARGADVLVNISNDSWLDSGDGAAPRQHFSMAIFRAIENRRYLVRVSSSGVSGFVTPYGATYATVATGTAGASVGRVVPLHGQTPYTRWGDAWVVAGGLVAAALLGRGRPEAAA